MPKTEFSGVQSVDRAIRILFTISENPGERFSLDKLSELLDIDRSSVFRLLSTLMKYGLVRQDNDRKTYQLGFGVFTLAAALKDQLKITEIAAPFLKQLAYATKENAHLAVRSGVEAIFIDRERAAKTIAANTNIGDTEELYCTSVGRCLICDMDESGLNRLFEGVTLRKMTENTIIELDELAREIEKVRGQGYAVDREENEKNVICVAAPIYNYEGAIEASIGISGPLDRMDTQLAAFTDEVRRAGEEISMILGRKSRS
jgi:DNA-binding IclR family transcriptional regulator